MGYTAIERFQQINQQRYGINGPQVPKPLLDSELSGNLEKQALRFIRETCENLRFDRETGQYRDLEDQEGRSIRPEQLPLYVERDLDRLCLENAVHRFMRSGTAVDAFDVYFCYLEMFVGEYRNSKKMIEMLAEFEQNASTLLMKHRDHYSHSVYVFLLGLAIYQNNAAFRSLYQQYYGGGAEHFMKYWGMTSLFHDIGYPFELPFEQVKSYFGNTIQHVPFVSYKGILEYVTPGQNVEKLKKLTAETDLDEEKLTIPHILARNIADKLEKEYSDFPLYRQYVKEHPASSYEEYLEYEVFARKPEEPEHFGGYMDHAYFSAVLLTHKLMDTVPEEKLNPVYTDVLSAIVLHNSMYKFSVTNVRNPDFNDAHRFRPEVHPLAYLLMLCDELQCWDRTSYGQNSRQEFHPMWCDLEFEGDVIHAVYEYDADFSQEKRQTGTFRKMQPGTEGKCSFLTEIEKIIRINEGAIGLTVSARVAEKRRRTDLYLSDSNFLHLYNFAVSLNAMYHARDWESKRWLDLTEEEMERDFDSLSLEYKLSNIAQAKAFSQYLNAIGCFYTDRPVAYQMKREFTVDELKKIGELEHERWDAEKYVMGWQYGTAYQEAAARLGLEPGLVREQVRMHNDLGVPFDELSKTEQNKDTDPMNDMMKLIEKYDGLRIYQMN